MASVRGGLARVIPLEIQKREDQAVMMTELKSRKIKRYGMDAGLAGPSGFILHRAGHAIKALASEGGPSAPLPAGL